MKKASFDKRQKLADLLINSVTLFSDKAIVKGNIPVAHGDVLNPATRWPLFSVMDKYRSTLGCRNTGNHSYANNLYVAGQAPHQLDRSPIAHSNMSRHCVKTQL